MATPTFDVEFTNDGRANFALDPTNGAGLPTYDQALRLFCDSPTQAAAFAAWQARNFTGAAPCLTRALQEFRGPFDVVAFNPPYLPGRPKDALDGAWHAGEAGSEVAARFLEDLPRVLAPTGRAYLLNRHNGPARYLAESSFRVKVLLSKALFFEQLDVLELRQGLE